jgi:hypothetical protein
MERLISTISANSLTGGTTPRREEEEELQEEEQEQEGEGAGVVAVLSSVFEIQCAIIGEKEETIENLSRTRI